MKLHSIGTVIATIILATSLAHAAKEMSVEVTRADLRSTPSAFSAIAGNVAYGDRVTVVETRGTWTKVRRNDNNREGWVKEDILTKKVLKITSGSGTDTGASSGELAIAGKGFTPEVENKFKASHKDIDFTWVDRMIGFNNDNSVLEKFVKEGELSAGKGGAK